jgi:hypothetical protein
LQKILLTTFCRWFAETKKPPAEATEKLPYLKMHEIFLDTKMYPFILKDRYKRVLG